jgi:hypothetical protein
MGDGDHDQKAEGQEAHGGSIDNLHGGAGGPERVHAPARGAFDQLGGERVTGWFDVGADHHQPWAWCMAA